LTAIVVELRGDRPAGASQFLRNEWHTHNKNNKSILRRRSAPLPSAFRLVAPLAAAMSIEPIEGGPVMRDQRPAKLVDIAVNGIASMRLRLPAAAEAVAYQPAATHRAALIGSSPEATTVLAMVSRFFADRGIFAEESPHFADPNTGRLFLRVSFDMPPSGLERLRRDFAPLAARLRMEWTIREAAARQRALIMVSRSNHCASDLLDRWEAGLLPLDIRAIVSNHPDAAPLAEAHDLPFHHLPVTAANRERQEASVAALIDDLSIDLVVLARYMRILPPHLCERLRGRCINIHHSFLPSFKGAKAYHQAHARGVKFIGATAHYVSADLDEGPIIEQVVERVDHSQTPEDFVGIGRDLERTALSRAVQWHAEGRVLLNGDRTVIFP
jgi:formyltetrahydrofolate deformylase